MRSATILAGALLSLVGCERGMHDMYAQAKFKPLTPTPLFADGNSSRPQVPGTIPYSGGAIAGTSSGRRELLAPTAPPLHVTLQLEERGRERFDVYCAPCHGRIGDGHGMIARRGFPSPPTFHSARLRDAPDQHVYQVISEGYGAMYPYADRILPSDRWAIVAYVRALQLSQNAPAAALDAVDRAALNRTP